MQTIVRVTTRGNSRHLLNPAVAKTKNAQPNPISLNTTVPLWKTTKGDLLTVRHWLSLPSIQYKGGNLKGIVGCKGSEKKSKHTPTRTNHRLLRQKKKKEKRGGFEDKLGCEKKSPSQFSSNFMLNLLFRLNYEIVENNSHVNIAVNFIY